MIQLHELLVPLTDEERGRIPAIISTLFKQDNFQILFRWMNGVSGGIASTSWPSLKDEDSLRCAFNEGQKSIPRDIYRHLLASMELVKEPSTVQDTTAPETPKRRGRPRKQVTEPENP